MSPTTSFREQFFLSNELLIGPKFQAVWEKWIFEAKKFIYDSKLTYASLPKLAYL